MTYSSNDGCHNLRNILSQRHSPRGSKMKEIEYNFIETKTQLMLPVSSWWYLSMEKNPCDVTIHALCIWLVNDFNVIHKKPAERNGRRRGLYAACEFHHYVVDFPLGRHPLLLISPNSISIWKYFINIKALYNNFRPASGGGRGGVASWLVRSRSHPCDNGAPAAPRVPKWSSIITETGPHVCIEI